MLRRVRGFSLVELMVAMTLGLIVTAAALGFLSQLLRAGAETVSSSRLQHELRTTMAIVVEEVRRARSVDEVVIASEGCFLSGEGGVRLHAGKVELLRGGGCGHSGLVVGSDAMRVMMLRFAYDEARNDRLVEVQLTAVMRRPPAFLAPREVTLRRVVALRSNGG